jgi:hypothetical protein
MGYDFQIGNGDVPHGMCRSGCLETGGHFYLTFNVSALLRRAHEDKIRAIYDKTGAEAVPILQGMVAYFEIYEEELRQMLQDDYYSKLGPNDERFGSYELTLDTLREALKASLWCRRYEPTARWQGD